MKATEQLDAEAASALLPETDRWVGRVLGRLEPLLASGQRLRVLEIGAAQGRGLIALHRRGLEAHGVEPWDEAIAVASELCAREGVSVEIRKGYAEQIPFESSRFDLVLAFAVMEHVRDLEQSLREIARVLVPGGVFWFCSTSAVCPRQNEIRGFPLFGWYPDALKKRIMRWAARARPDLVGGTDAPALHWWTPRRARRLLHDAGFDRIWDRWDLCAREDLAGRLGPLRGLLKDHRWLRPLADVVVPDCAYAARKGR